MRILRWNKLGSWVADFVVAARATNEIKFAAAIPAIMTLWANQFRHETTIIINTRFNYLYGEEVYIYRYTIGI